MTVAQLDIWLTNKERGCRQKNAGHNNLGVAVSGELRQQVHVEDGEAVTDAVDDAVNEERRKHHHHTPVTAAFWRTCRTPASTQLI